MTEETNGNDMSAGTNHRVGTAITLGALAAGAAAAGYYFYGSEDAEKHRKQAASWSRSFKKEVARQMEGMGSMNKETIAAAVDKAVGIYERLRAVDAAELLHAARELKTHWQAFSEEMSRESKKGVASVRSRIVRSSTSGKRSTRSKK